LAPRKPLVPGQASWMNHVLGDGTNTARKPAAVKPPTPQQRSGQTRTRARVASVTPDYDPQMNRSPRQSAQVPASRSGSGRVRGPGPRFRLRSPMTPTTMNRSNVLSGGRVAATGVGVPKPPASPPVGRPIPPIPSSLNAASAGTKGTRFMKVFGKVGKIAIPAAGGVVGGTLLAAEGLKQAGLATGASKPYNTVVGPAEMKAVKQYGAKAVQDAKRESYGANPPAPAPAAKPTSSGATLPPSPKKKLVVGAKSKMSDYGAAPKGKTGRFLRNAYYTNRLNAINNTRSPYDSALATPSEMKAAEDRFKATHKWARNAKTKEQKRNLQAAVTYLANRSDRRYFGP